MTTEELTPRQQEILDLIKEGWSVFGPDLKYNSNWCAYAPWVGNLGRKWPRRNTIKALLTKGYIAVEPDEKNPEHFKAKLRLDHQTDGT